MMGLTNRYQFNVPSLLGFRKEMAEKYGLTEDNVLVTAGSAEKVLTYLPGIFHWKYCYRQSNFSEFLTLQKGWERS